MTNRRRIAAAALAFLTALWVSASPSFAAKLPEWAKALVATAPPVPEGVPKHAEHVLLDETRYAVQPDGSIKIRYRLGSIALSVNTYGIGVRGFPFDDTTKMTASRAWHLPPGEKAERSWEPPIDFAAGDSFLSDSKVRAIRVDDVKKGSMVFFEFEAIRRPYFLPIRHLVFENAPISLARVELETPPGWTVQSAWLRRDPIEPLVSGNARVWELRDLPAFEEEDLAYEPIDYAPLLAINVVPPGGAKVASVAMADWPALSRWYEDLAKGRHDVTPQIESAARKIQPPAETPFLERVRAAGKQVRDSVRYVAVELGIGGYQPHPASETLTNLYGDCKDKATLFRAFLGAEKIASYPVLVNLTSPDTVPEDIPLPTAFNHLIAAVPIPPSEPILPAFEPAVVEAGDLGRLLIVDTTDDRTSIGSLSAALAGKKVLVVAGEKGRLVTLPAGEPSHHVLERRLGLEIRSNRSIGYTRATTRTGDFASWARASYGNSSVDRRKGIEQAVMRLWPDATVKDYSAEYETPEGAFIETVTFDVRPLPAEGPGSKVELFPGASGEIERVALGKRKTAVVYEHPQTLRYVVTIQGVPESSALPNPQNASGEGWKVTTTYAREGAKVTATWEAVLSKTRWPVESFQDLRKFWSAASAASNWSVAAGG